MNYPNEGGALCIHGYQFDCQDCRYGTLDQIVKRAAAEVYKELGQGHSENVYESALDVELTIGEIKLDHRRQVPCTMMYKEHCVGTGFIDIMIGKSLIVEIKTVAKLSNKDEQQVFKYLTATGVNHGLLINFGNELETQLLIQAPGGPYEIYKGNDLDCAHKERHL